MNRFYILLFIASVFVTACTPTAVVVDEPVKKSDVKAESNTDRSYKTVTLKADIPSPRKEMRGLIGHHKITVNYGSPSVKGRQIWGKLVPYGKVWRMGANEATTIETSTDLKIEGQKLAAGKYGLFTIPSENGDWTVIFNSVPDQWGAYNYDKSKDVLRVKAKAQKTGKMQEALDFSMDLDKLVMKWEKTWLLVKVDM
jgi:hypothetical protein